MQKERIKVVGVGGAGCHVVNHIMKAGLPGVELVAVDTDWASIRACEAHRKVELRGIPVPGLGTGGVAEWARKTAEACSGELCEVVSESSLSLIIAGMGGGTGSGAAPVVARIAREAGALAVGIVTTPLILEGKRRMCIAVEGLNTLGDAASDVIIVPCEELLEITGRQVTIAEFFVAANEVLYQIVRWLVGDSAASRKP